MQRSNRHWRKVRTSLQVGLLHTGEDDRTCKRPASLISALLREILRNEILDNHHVTPDAIELTVLQIHPNFAKSNALDECAAGGILDEDARHELPEASLSGGFQESDKG